MCGSPPRVWGNRRLHPRPRLRRRFTPTCVGRMACARGSMHAVGSPPRVWGNARPRRRARSYIRFTPTRVGKSRRLMIHAAVGSPPRVWGNHPPVTCSTSGSPPRVWGNLHRCHVRHQRGSPPRVWGRLRLDVTRDGSPPRVWGNRASGLRARAVHPHACGENRCSGSAGGGRFTPTRVGKSVSVMRSMIASPGSPPRGAEIRANPYGLPVNSRTLMYQRCAANVYRKTGALTAKR